MSTLTAFPLIAEGSEGTPGLWNRVFSQLSDNVAAVQGDVLTGHFQQLSIGSTPPSYVTTAAVTITVNSASSDYFYLTDSSAARSSYVIGSRAGGTADGLNIWDASGQTMIVSFSKQSVRFFQQVVGPVFDVGGALASTLNAATFGGSLITTQIQAAISAATLAVPKIKRVYVPASMYPYDPRQMSFDTNVQMVREGGAWDIYDVQAYGANPVLSAPVAWNTTAIQAAIHGANGSGGGVVYVPTGQYGISSLTVPRKVTLRGSGGGRYLDSTTVSQLYQGGSTGTTALFLVDQGGSGVVVEHLQIGAAPATNLGAIRIAGMSFCQIRNVSISGVSGFAIQIEGGNDTVLNTLQDCAITMSSQGTAIDILGGPSGMDSTPYMTGCFVSCDAPTAWISIKSTSSGVAPDSPLFTNNRFITTSTTTALYGLMTNGRFLGNRFEAIAGSLNVTLAPPAGPQYAAVFLGNSYALTGGTLVWTDSATTSSPRVLELVNNYINSVPGTAVNPSYAFGSENSLGFYRSGVSTVGLSYGALAFPTGTALTPSLTFSSESSLGVFRSGASSLALSYGSLRLPVGSEFLMLGGGSPPLPLRLWASGADFYITANQKLDFTQDNTGFGSWRIDCNCGNGSQEAVVFSHTTANGSAVIRMSLLSSGDLGVGTGTALSPSYQYLSEKSLGWYRSAASVMALSYGGLGVKNGTNASFGTAVLGSNGSVNVATTYVAAGDVIFLTDQTAGGTLGDIEVGGIRAGSGFTIQSTSITDTSTVGWLIVRAAV